MSYFKQAKFFEKLLILTFKKGGIVYFTECDLFNKVVKTPLLREGASGGNSGGGSSGGGNSGGGSSGGGSGASHPLAKGKLKVKLISPEELDQIKKQDILILYRPNLELILKVNTTQNGICLIVSSQDDAFLISPLNSVCLDAVVPELEFLSFLNNEKVLWDLPVEISQESSDQTNEKYLNIKGKEGRCSNREGKALFLDRDGVIIEDFGYIKSSKDVILKDGIIDLIKAAQSQSYCVFVVTNQSGIGRNYYTWKEYYQVTKTLIDQLSQNDVQVDEIVAAPFHSEGQTEVGLTFPQWRKPRSGMFLDLAIRYSINYSQSIMIGDKATDLIPAYLLGFHSAYLIDIKKDFSKDQWEQWLDWLEWSTLEMQRKRIKCPRTEVKRVHHFSEVHL